MLTINLEKELIKSNQKLVIPEELLLIKEYEKHSEFVADDVMNRIGLNQNVLNGKMINDKINSLKQETLCFNQERVFHISQIQNICEKYYLRFLNIKHYKGSVDNQIPFKITTFETAYSKKCLQKDMFIIAPAKSFQLEEKPKDPLLFYQINDEYFYLIHKWGNDLSIFNRLKSIFSNTKFTVSVLALASIMIFFHLKSIINNISIGEYVGLSLICSIVFGILCAMFTDSSDSISFIKSNKWDSKFR